MHTNVTHPSLVSIILKTDNYTSVIQENIENNTPRSWEKKKVLVLGRHTRQVIIEIHIRPGSHVAIDDLRLEDCLPEYYTGITELGCPEDSHYLCMDNSTCIPQHRVCDINIDCPDKEDESESCYLVPDGSRCTFESGFCGWQNSSEEMSLLWRLYQGDRRKFTGPRVDNTYRNKTGTFAYVDMSGPAYLGSAARMESVHFHPPPPCSSDPDSKYYNSCYISFFYHKYGTHSGSLGLYVVETHGDSDRMRRLWWSFGNFGNTWLRAVVYLENITTNYYLQFEARKFMSQKGDVAIDDISMSPKCFGLDLPKEALKGYRYAVAGTVNETATRLKIPMHPDFKNKTVYRFTTCGSTGRLGPSNRSCEVAYNNSTVSVVVVNDTYMDGVQIWRVPETGVYTIVAKGARGGKGADGMGISKGSTAIVVVELYKDQELRILVGQEGGDACRKTFDKQDGACQREQYFRSGSALKVLHDLRLLNGGGGGGGGSFVFTVECSGFSGDYENNGSQEHGFYPLVIGAGGGGLAHGPFKDDSRQHGNGTNPRLPPITAPSFGENPAGAGGGWLPGNYTDDTKLSGAALTNVGGVSSDGGGVGGKACYKSRAGTKGFGGFGGGGGGCVAGGGGGGFTGGRAWSNSQSNGEGGWSYLPNPESVFYSAVYPGSHYGSGTVHIIPSIVGCGCAYLCATTNQLRNSVRCICPTDFKIGPDGKSCIYQSTETTKIIFLITGSVFALVFICLIIGIWMYRSYRKRKERKENVTLLHNGILNCNIPLRNRNGNADINPTYDFNGRTLSTRDLPRISREELRIQKSIGEGAFGVVYRGYYKKTGETIEMKVAIKTLQPKKDMANVEVKFDDEATPNAELEREKKRRIRGAEICCIRDFLTEAIIMSQFKHPNIVKFIGITFEKNYRFIVTELLSGGDLKEFLRKNRPSVQQDHRVIPIRLKDLIKMALDIAKGCAYLEHLHFIHRDIAARNCLLSSTGRGRVTKIADFGMSRDVYRNEYYRKDGQAMLPIKWMPSESLADGVFNSKTDVWSFGITLWEIMTFGNMPYTGMTNKETMNYVLRGGRLARPNICPEPVYKLMCFCWKTNPQHRPNFEYIRNKLRLFIQDPEILNYKPPVIGRPAAPLPYRASHPLEDPEELNQPRDSNGQAISSCRTGYNSVPGATNPNNRNSYSRVIGVAGTSGTQWTNDRTGSNGHTQWSNIGRGRNGYNQWSNGRPEGNGHIQSKYRPGGRNEVWPTNGPGVNSVILGPCGPDCSNGDRCSGKAGGTGITSCGSRLGPNGIVFGSCGPDCKNGNLCASKTGGNGFTESSGDTAVGHHQDEQHEEPEYVTPMAVNDSFDDPDGELMKNFERYGKTRGSEMTLVDDCHEYHDEEFDDLVDVNGVGEAEGEYEGESEEEEEEVEEEERDDDEEEEDDDEVDEEDNAEDGDNMDGGNNDNAENDGSVGEEEDDGIEDDDDEINGEEQNIEDEEDDDKDAEEIILDADRNPYDDEADDSIFDDNTVIRDNGSEPSYNWNRFKETSFISMKEPRHQPAEESRQSYTLQRRKSFSELEDNRPNHYSLAGRVRYNVASDGQITC